MIMPPPPCQRLGKDVIDTLLAAANPQIHPACLLPPIPDVRDRSKPEYFAFEQHLALDVGKRGVRNPILVRIDGENLRVMAGETRRRASLVAGLSAVPIRIHQGELSAQEVALETLLENEMRSDLTDPERAEQYLAAMTQMGWSRSELAQAVGKSESLISKILAWYERFPEDLRDKIGRGEGKLPSTAAAAIARLEDVAAIREVTLLAIAQQMKRDAVISLVNGRLGKKEKKAKTVKVSIGKGIALLVTGSSREVLRAAGEAIVKAAAKMEKEGWTDVAAMLPHVIREGSAS